MISNQAVNSGLSKSSQVVEEIPTNPPLFWYHIILLVAFQLVKNAQYIQIVSGQTADTILLVDPGRRLRRLLSVCCTASGKLKSTLIPL